MSVQAVSSSIPSSTLTSGEVQEFPVATQHRPLPVSDNLCRIYESCGDCASLSTNCGWCDSIGACIALEDATYCSDSVVTTALQCSWNTGWLITWWFLWGLSLFIFPLALYAALRCLCARRFTSSVKSRKVTKPPIKKAGSPKPMQQQVVLLSSSDIDHMKAAQKPIVPKPIYSPAAVSAVPVFVYQPQHHLYPSPLVPQPAQGTGVAQYSMPPCANQARAPICPAINNQHPIALQEPASLRPLSPRVGDSVAMRSSLNSTENFTRGLLSEDNCTTELTATTPIPYNSCNPDLSNAAVFAQCARDETQTNPFERGNLTQSPQIPEMPRAARGITAHKPTVEAPTDPAKLFLTPRVHDHAVEKLRQELDEQRQRNQVLEDRVAWLNRVKK